MPLKPRLYHLIFAVLITVWSGCAQGPPTRPEASGRPGEILLVADDDVWNTVAGKALTDILTAEQYGLPQGEAQFRFSRLPQSNFSGILKLQKNIVYLELAEEPVSISYRNDVWSAPQLVVRIAGSNIDSIAAYLRENYDLLLQALNDAERNRIVIGYQALLDAILQKTVKDSFGVSLITPKGFQLAVSKNNFMWLRRETQEMSQGIIIYETAYTDTSDFVSRIIVSRRDSICLQHIPGPSEGSYMATEMSYPVKRNVMEVDSNFAVELRGLWRTEGDFMGGPFVSYSIHNPSRGTIITIEGFVFAPRYNKREYLRQVEAIARSATF